MDTQLVLLEDTLLVALVDIQLVLPIHQVDIYQLVLLLLDILHLVLTSVD